MSIFNRKQKNVSTEAIYKMITDTGNGFYAWNGKLYQSDIVRACIKPKTKAIGKLLAKHIRTIIKDSTTKIETNPQPYIRFLLEEPNEYMSGQVMQEKVANQLALNNNAFVLIIRDSFGLPCALYPIPCVSVEAKYINNILHLKFYFLMGKTNTFPYSEIIHIRDDYFENDIFGNNPTEALTQLMNIVGTIDQGIIKAIKNGGAIKWLLKFFNSLRPEDITTEAKRFADSFLSINSNSTGVAAVDSKAEAIQIQPHDYVPNSAQTDKTVKRIYNFFNTNEKIVNSTYTEDEWISYFEAVIEPVSVQMSNEYTRKLFSRRERGCGNKIIFEASNLEYASMNTKISLFKEVVINGGMLVNEWRNIMNWGPIDGGDKPIRRLDIAQVEATTGGDDDGNSGD